jgi:uncharacterized protein
MDLKKKYGKLALVAGASEGLGAAFSQRLAAEGFDLVLVARREAPLLELAATLRTKYGVSVSCLVCDLAKADAATYLAKSLEDSTIDLLVYNAAIPYIGGFETDSIVHQNEMVQANAATQMNMLHLFGSKMLAQGRGGIVVMASIAGFQGSGFLAVYAATKAFNRVLAESLWYEWKGRGVDVIACCAGATATPNYLDTKPEATSFFAPAVQSPEAVVTECFAKLGKKPSFIAGKGNKLASFFMQHVLPRKLAITIMGDTARKMFRL